jgi:hypothetical protein
MADGDISFEIVVHGNGICALACEDNDDCGGETCLLVDGLDEEGVCGKSCDPDNAGECAPGESCVSDGDQAGCVPDGSECDPDADEDECQAGAGCVTLAGSDTSVCMPVCHQQDRNGCNDNGACINKTDPFWHTGICLGTDESCDVISQSDCDPGQSCGLMGGPFIGGHAYICGDSGTVPEDGDCEDSKCLAGLTCVDDVCRAYCETAADACVKGSCEDASEKFNLEEGSIGLCE